MKRHHTAAVAAFACTTMVLAGCGQGEAPSTSLDACLVDPVGCNAGDRADGGEITWALDGSWGAWNQNTSQGNNAYLSMAVVGMWPYTGQFDQSGDFIVNEGLFASPPELISENPVTVEYTLKSGANWGDGTDVSVDDFIYHWYATSGDAALCDGCDPANITRGSQVESITGSGSQITVTYKDSYHSAEWQYEEVLSQPAHVAEAQGFDWKNDPKAMAAAEEYFSATVPTWSTGPFVIEDAKAGDYVIYRPNEDWAGDTEVTLDKITFKVIDGIDNIVTALRNEEVDGASPFAATSEAVTQLETADGVSYAVAGGPSWEHIDLNTKNEFLSDVALRQAVFTAIDVENIISRTYAFVQSDIERKGNHLFRNGSDYYADYLSATGQGSGDIEMARGILEAAGYTWDGDGALLTPEGDEVELDFRYSETKESRKITGTLAQATLADLGIDVELRPIPDAELGDVLGEGDFDMINFGWSSDPLFVAAASQYWETGSGSNFGGLEDPELDQLIAEINGTLDYDEAAERANLAVKRVIEDAYSLPIVDTPVMVMVSDRLVNVRDNWASQQRAAYNIAEWGVSGE
ncbi:ABC transporter family substrate-binding protein [Glycomyces sp. TRM65418]|uniref:ABC transporter family substrate-binding protein n=1 Tax=Glycomyces sp. TRM65418 TaxID=2867006 RepID=UPI001CE69869|nr:ABC transporter family substrate-binding protein [Glycomyces sp. TRM65418]MCC3763703.1 ABC transporter family substrate-binding protein [Glycomyces sp. TRM65418]QZD57682.1 ABC transporter family substrate-binding protein [Glycomyces sp. TRM65418]